MVCASVSALQASWSNGLMTGFCSVNAILNLLYQLREESATWCVSCRIVHPPLR